MKLTQKRMSRPSLAGFVATRQGALVLALVCALAATGILVFALGQYRSGLKPPAVPNTIVLVSTAPIPKGTPGAQVAARNLVHAVSIPATQASPGAIGDTAALQGTLAATTIVAGQQLTSADFTATPGVAGLLLPDQRAISLSISEAPGNTDALQVGDHVDIYADFKANKNGDSNEVVLLDPNITVMKVPNSVASATAKTGTTALTGSSLLLNITSAQAADLIYAEQHATTLYLTLRPPNGTASPRTVTTLSSVLADSVATVNPQNGTHP